MMNVVWSSSFNIIGCLVLNVLHGFYYFYLLIYSVYCNFLRKTRFLYQDIITSSKNIHHVYGSTEYFFSKLPKHLAIIIGSECVHYNDLVKLILWSNQFGINFISFYQHSNSIEPVLLYEAFYKYNKEYLKKIVWCKSFENIKEQVRKDLNGYTRPDPSEQLRVNVFTSQDGVNHLLDVTKRLSKTHSSSDSITQNVIDSAVRSKIMSPDPDLAIVFGDTYSSFGFLPWHISVTEFVRFDSHHNITSRDFITLLEKYSRCEQRFGK